MSNNCLVTKLKEVVDNDNLVIFGVLRFKTQVVSSPSANTQRIIFGNSAPVTIKVTGGFIDTNWPIQNQNTETTLPIGTSNRSVFISNSEATVDVYSKYDVSEISNIGDRAFKSIDAKQLSGCYAIRALTLKGGLVYGDTSQLKNLVNIEECNFENSTELSGSITDFSQMENINLLYLYNTNVSGTLEDFVVGQISSGRTQQTSDTGLKMFNALKQFTFGGNSYNITYTTLTWESSTKIAVLEWASSALASLTKVYCKGYTQEEAEAKWPNSTIVRVDA